MGKTLFLNKLNIILIVFILSFCIFSFSDAYADDLVIQSDITTIEVFDNTKVLIFYLTDTDYMTADDWSATSNESYKWVDTLNYENRNIGNVCNASLDKNLDIYNYGSYILINGIELSNYPVTLMANKFQRVNGFGITIEQDVSVLEIQIKKGCTIPTLTASYFGINDGSAICIDRDIRYKYKNGLMYEVDIFDGYELNTEYDASESYIYKREPNGTYKGHNEASLCEFSTFFAENNLGDNGYTLVSENDTNKGSLMVIEFVNPINTATFGLITIRFYSQYDRVLYTHKAEEVTYSSLGGRIDKVQLNYMWTEVTLITSLYANLDGYLDTLVFEFDDDGGTGEFSNQIFIGSFTISTFDSYKLVYDSSLIIDQNDEDYTFSFRFNKKGTFDNLDIDTSKVLINSCTIDEIEKMGMDVNCEWVSLVGFYQINVAIKKDDISNSFIKFSDKGYKCNKMSVLKGLEFPNGDKLTTTYSFNIYNNEKYIDGGYYNYEYEETNISNIYDEIQETKNLHIQVVFDKCLISSPYYHATQTEEWREKLLKDLPGLYNKTKSEAFVIGGYKSCLYDKIVINGLTIGEIHTLYSWETSVFVNMAQSNINSLDIFFDSNSPFYKKIIDGYRDGNDFSLIIKKGLIFPSGYMTTRNYSFILENGKFILEGESSSNKLYFDGVEVKDGDILEVKNKVLESSIYIDTSLDYIVKKRENNNEITFNITYANGDTLEFVVKENISEIEESKGCNSSFGGYIILMLISIIIIKKERLYA